MHTGIISFADRIVYNIKSNDVKDVVLEQLYRLYNIKIIQRHFHKLDETNVKYIKNNPHLCSLRSNGNPYYMFFTLYNDIPIIYFIDKKIHPGYQKPRILLTRGLFNESLFKNTLIDGEMIKTNNGKWLYLMNDIISYEGKFLIKTILPDRLKILYELLETKYKPDKIIDVCYYKIKTYQYVCKESVQQLIELSKKLNYTCRGVYMWSYDLRYKPKLLNFNEDNIINVVRKVKDETIFRIKSDDSSSNHSGGNSSNMSSLSNKHSSFDEGECLLYVSKTDDPDVYNLYDNDTKSNNVGTALVSKMETSKMLRLAFKNTNAAALIKVKCVYNNTFNKWQPIKIL